MKLILTLNHSTDSQRDSIAPRIWRHTAIRWAIRFVLIYAALIALAVALFVWLSQSSYDDEIAEALESRYEALTKLPTENHAAALQAQIGKWNQTPGGREMFYSIRDRSNQILAGDLNTWPDAFDNSLPRQDKPGVSSVWIEEEYFRERPFDDDALLPVIAGPLSNETDLLLAVRVEQQTALMEVSEFLIEGLAAAFFLTILTSVSLGISVQRRLDNINRTAGEIMRGDLSQRIEISERADEFDALSRRLNAMLDRIQELVQGIRAVTDNISHDLRGPLTRLRNELELTLREDRDPAHYRASIGQGIEEVDALIDTFNALLRIAQAEAGNHRSEWEPVSLGELASAMTELYKPVAEDRNQILELNLESAHLRVCGSRELLAQAIGNLLDNACKYTPAGGRIRLGVTRQKNNVELSITDSGPGIPEDMRAHVLERFTRLESARQTHGNGLGLSLVSAVSRLHDAELQLSDASPGLRVSLRFQSSSVHS